MRLIENQVKVLGSTITGRDKYLNLEHVVLFPGQTNEVKLGTYLQRQDKRIDALENTIKDLKTIIKAQTAIISKLNLK